LLTGPHAVLLDEWLRRLNAGGWRVPPEHAVTLLLRTRGYTERHAAVRQACGPLAPWLATTLPDLHGLVEPELDPEEAWRVGSPAARAEALRVWRSEDPGAARQRLEDALAAGPGPERAVLTAALSTGLGPDDEPLLERLLDDRVRAVRHAAASLLVELPASRLATRMAERVAGLLAAGRPPLPVPPDWVRDGLPATPDSEAALVEAVVGAAPIDRWDPADTTLEQARTVGPFAAAWRAGLVARARRGRSEPWARLLVEPDGDDLVALLSRAERVDLARRQLHGTSALGRLSLAAFESLSSPWPAELLRAVVDSVVLLFEEGRLTWQHRPALQRFVLALDPEGLGPLVARLDATPPHAHLALVRAEVVALASTRHDLVRELT
jgi:hypothetical protein